MTTSTASVPLTYGTWTSIGTAPLDAAVASSSYGAYVHLRESDSQPAAGAQPHYRLNASNPFAALRSGAQVWATVAGADPTFVATLDVTTGIEIPGSSGGGGGGGSNASVGSTGAAVPASATAVGFQNAAGNLVLPAPSAGLPVADSGAPITGATIPAGGVGLTGWLSAIWTKLTGTLTVSWSGQSVAVSNFPSSQTVAVSNLPGTQAISAASLPLPSGAAQEAGGNLASIAANVSTATNQATANTTLASILTKLSAALATTETYANLATAQVSVAATATLIVAARVGRKEVTIVNHGTTAVYLGPSGVATTTGQLLAGVAGEGITYSGGAAVYGIAATGSQTVSVAEVY
jgi:hypothetical protein